MTGVRLSDIRADLISEWYSSKTIAQVARRFGISISAVRLEWHKLGLEGVVPQMLRYEHHPIDHPRYTMPTGASHSFKEMKEAVSPGDKYDGRPSTVDPLSHGDPLLARLQKYHKLEE